METCCVCLLFFDVLSVVGLVDSRSSQIALEKVVRISNLRRYRLNASIDDALDATIDGWKTIASIGE